MPAAARNPDLVAVVDPTRCEAKGPCVAACPEDALTVVATPDDVWARLSFLHKLKNRAHGRKLAVVDAGRCAGCAACVPVCPERAIRMVRRGAGA